MKIAFFLVGLIVTNVAAAARAHASKDFDVTFASLLREMVDRSVVTRWPKHEYKSLQSSSYNRQAVSPDKPGWFANGDQGFDLRTEENAERKEAVLMEHQGPGVLTRIWTPFFHKSLDNRQGKTVRIYLDGSETPAITANLFDLVLGRQQVPPPFAQPTCRSGDLYLPICFQKSCKVTLEDESFFYIINYRSYEAGTKVETFRMDLLKSHSDLLATVGEQLRNPSNDQTGELSVIEKEILPTKSESLSLPKGAAAISHLEFKLEADDLFQAMRSTVLEIRFDGRQTVWCPIGDFFANVNAIDPYTMWEREVQPDGKMICRWIMPYQISGQIRIHNLSSDAVTVSAKARVIPWQWDQDSLHFHANWWTDMPRPPRPVRDLNFIDIQGQGIHVGDNFIVLNPHWHWWGEGDEKIYVDDDVERKFPSHFGTGTEDYYGWAGGVVPTREDEFSSPFLANVRVGGQSHADELKSQGGRPGPFTRGYNICSRTRALDATPFKARFRFDMESFNLMDSPDAYLQYALVTFWYGTLGATHNREPLSHAAAAQVPTPEDVEAFAKANVKERFRIPNAIECEILELKLTPSRPRHNQRIRDLYAPHKFSNDSICFVQTTQPRDSAAFVLGEQYHPKRIVLHPVTAPDFGKLDILVNDELVLSDWDGYSSKPAAGDPIDLGVHPPDGNVFRIKLVVKQKNKASTNHYFGMDCIIAETPNSD